MATFNVSTSAGMISAMSSASPGDEIVLASGNYAAVNVSNILKGATTASWDVLDNNIVIRPADINNPPRFNVGRFEWTNIRGFTLDGINFYGSAIETPTADSGPGTYPDLTEALKFYDCRNIKMVNCDIRWHKSSLRVTNCDYFMVSRCHFYECGIDNIMLYGSSRDLRIWDNVFDRPKIDYGRDTESVRHPDNIQGRVNTSQVGTNPMYRISILRNLFDMDPQSGKPVFLMPQNGLLGTAYAQCQIEDNMCRTGRSNCIVIGGADNCTIDGNTIISIANKVPQEEPRIWMKGQNNSGGANSGSITNNVMHRAISYSSPAKASDWTISGNIIDPTGVARPTGWTELIAGENVGPYTDSEVTPPTQPTQPTTEWSNPPTNTISKDGRFGTFTEISDNPGRYAGVLIIPSDSVAVAVAASNSLNDKAEIKNFRWTDGTHSGFFRVANPSTNTPGWRRYEMTGYSVAAGGTMSNLVWGYEVNGVWSEYSSYTGGFTAPGSPPIEEGLDPLEEVDWEVQSTGAEVIPGRIAPSVIVPTITYTGLQWTPEGGDGIWRNLAKVREEGGEDVMQLLPSQIGGEDHTAPYGGSLSFRLRYSTGGDFSEASTDFKTFSAPAVPNLPSILDGWTSGDLMLDSDNPLVVSGHPLIIADMGVPSHITVDGEQNPVFLDDDEVIVTLPSSPPLGAVDQMVFYAGKHYLADRENPIVSFPYIEGEDWVFACGLTSQGKLGRMAFWRIN